MPQQKTSTEPGRTVGMPFASLDSDADTSPATRCPVCGSDRSAGWFEARDHHYGNPGIWRERRCAACDSFYLDPRPSAADLLAMYPQDTYYSFQLPPERRGRERVKRWLGLSLAPREPRFAVPGRVLDFGCGAGQALLAMRREGWKCAGVEVSEAGVAVARAQGLQVERDLSAFPDAAFDYVRANHSLEHVVDPRATVREFWRVLAPGGTLFIGVPTNSGQNARLFGAYWWHLAAPVHTVVFSTKALVRLVQEANFQVQRVSTNSDTGSFGGSLQLFLNRHTQRRAGEGIIFRVKPLLALGLWVARLQDRLGAGDKLELVASKPLASKPRA